ncbi:MAG: DUF2891 domain-containing protein [Planctomycetota bacterium]
MTSFKSLVWLLLVCGVAMSTSVAEADDTEKTTMDVLKPVAISDADVCALMELAMKGIEQEFPNKPSNVMTSAEDVLRPQEMHPVFYGCFDWHSSVHGHWLLVRLLKLYPDSGGAAEARALLNRQLTASKLQTEADYFDKKENKSFERMYGWAWALRLATELHGWEDPDGQRWAANLKPLEQKLVVLAKDYLPKLSYPIRTGQHPDTGFALGQLLDYARTVGDAEMDVLIQKFAREKYLGDVDYPARYEPSGHDFFSTCLNEADLMRRVLDTNEFAEWLSAFLPELDKFEGSANSILTPEEVPDVTDGKLVHLAGLNFNRAWAQLGIYSALEEGDPRRVVLAGSIASHTQAGMDYVFSGHYEGEHWLATFAVYTLTRSGCEPLSRTVQP